MPGVHADKFTYNGGIEVRPTESLLVRAAYGTAFRAPDLHYLFTGPGNVESSVIDYYTCRQDDPDAGISDCEDYDVDIVAQRSGNRDLKAETGKTLTAGWSSRRRATSMSRSTISAFRSTIRSTTCAPAN